MILINFIKKIIRLLFYSLKGNFIYAFSQFRITNAGYYFSLNIIKSSFGKSKEKAAVFNIEDGNLGRYAFNILNTFKSNNYSIYLKPNYNFYATCNGLYIINIFTFLRVNILFFNNNLKKYKEVIWISTSPINTHQNYYYNKHILLSFNGLSNHTSDIVLPFSFHPLIYTKNSLFLTPDINSFIISKRQSKRQFPIFFGGQINHISYNSLNENFPKLINRNIFFKILFNSFKNQISNQLVLDNIKKSKTSKKSIIILDKTKNDISPVNWFDILGNTDFFLCPPGFEMPMSHNVIEAMACGAIPIIQYSKVFSPPLKNRLNCLQFENESELIDALNTAINMSQSQISSIRKNVINYFHENLCSESFIKRIENSKNKSLNISVIAGEKSINYLKQN